MSKNLYWEIEGADAKAIMAEIDAQLDAFAAHCEAMIDKYGGDAAKVLVENDGSLCGIRFSTPPSSSLWKDAKGFPGYYSPRRNSKAGKSIAADFKKVRRPTNQTVATRFLGQPFAIVDMALCSAGIERFGDRTIVVARESDEWEPIAGLRRMKASEFYALKEELEDCRQQPTAKSQQPTPRITIEEAKRRLESVCDPCDSIRIEISHTSDPLVHGGRVNSRSDFVIYWVGIGRAGGGKMRWFVSRESLADAVAQAEAALSTSDSPSPPISAGARESARALSST